MNSEEKNNINNQNNINNRKLNKELKKIKRYQRTKSIVLNSQINILIDKLNRFNNEYSKLIDKFDKKIKNIHHNTSEDEPLIELETINNTQKILIDQMIKLNNIFSLTNKYIDNFNNIIDRKDFVNDTTISENGYTSMSDTENTSSRMNALQLSMFYVSSILSNISYEIPFDNNEITTNNDYTQNEYNENNNQNNN